MTAVTRLLIAGGDLCEERSERERLTRQRRRRRRWWANAALRCQEGAAFYSTSMISHGSFKKFALVAEIAFVGDGYYSSFLTEGKCLKT